MTDLIYGIAGSSPEAAARRNVPRNPRPANGLPAGGRPQVTLKRGQWFESRGCPDWRVK